MASLVIIAIWTFSVLRYSSILAQNSSTYWTPFDCTLIQDQYIDAPGGPYRIKVEGVYARNSQGMSYNRRTASTRSPLPLVGTLDMAFFHDRPNHITYVIDFANRTIKQQSDPSGNPDFALEPPSRAVFDARHAGDLSLGKQILSGVECEGYKLADPHHNGKYNGEEWFAPSLNFLAVRYEGRPIDGRQISFVIKDLESGREPDPRFFVLPAGFKRVK
jgi:hypothetical protein